jgi:pimeloyl-ACP methyl ester carboxylesterase
MIMTVAVTLVLVHGAWHGPWCWQLLRDQLRGVEVRAVALSSSGSDPSKLGDLYEDAEIVRSVVTDVKGPVVVCAHSYGGAAVTEALVDMRNVRRLVYLCGWQLDVGESPLGARQGVPPPWWEVHEAEGYVDALRPRETFYADVDPVTADAAIARLGHQSLASVSEPLTQVSWRKIPSTYVICEKDSAIPPAVQERMARRAHRVQRLNTSHSPFMSQPSQVAHLLHHELKQAAATD